jgi:peptidoglycan/LPS O-acetylase OafA/YrhL
MIIKILKPNDLNPLQASSPLIGLLKWVAAQVIVAHHLAAYGPFAEAGHAEMPQLFDFLSDCGAWAVSVFLVIAGFLAAQSQEGKPVEFQSLPQLAIHRYVRLAPVYLVGLTLSVGVALLLHRWVSPDMLPAHLDASVLVANFLFLQDILGWEALSAGIWYVAIDLQLYVLFLCLASMAHLTVMRGHHGDKRWVWAAVGLLSLGYFNLHPNWNIWAIYFAGAYALGALAYRSTPLLKKGHGIFGLYLAGAFFCAWTEPRPRLFVAILTAAVLYSAQYISISHHVWTALARKAGDCAYGLFMSHFSMLMLLSCVYPGLKAWGIPFECWLLAIFVCCNALGWFIWRYIDGPVQRIWFKRDSNKITPHFL